MDKSRIPKFSFGFKKPSPKTNGIASEGNSPRGMPTQQVRAATPTGIQSAPGSNNTSPNLSRSKSLRVPRSTHYNLKSYSNSALLEEEGGDGGLKSHSSSCLERNQDTPKSSLERNRDIRKARSSSSLEHNQDYDGGEGVDHTPVTPRRWGGEGARSEGFIRPRSKTIGAGGRRALANRNSHSVSPNNTEEITDLDSLEGVSPLQRQAKSFTAKKPSPLANGSSLAPSPASSIARANSVRRSKTPTALRSRYNQDTTTTSASEGRSLVRTSSIGRLAQQAAQNQDGPETKVILRKSSTRREREAAGGRPHQRPTSTYSPEDAGIFSNNVAAQSHASKGQEVKKGDGSGRKNSSSAAASLRSHSSMDSTRSPSPNTGLSSSSLHVSSQSSTGPSPTSSHTPKPSKYLSTKSRSSSIENTSRPSSAAACYRRGSGKDPSKDPTGGKLGSTPSSGRTTPVGPVHRVSLGSNSGKEGTDGGVVSTPSRANSSLPPRTPYRVARTKAVPSSELAGMNELQGSVLLEADDYRMLFNEVKALKTALLKLKREIQEDTGASTPNNNNNSRVGRARTSPMPGQMSSMETSKRLKTLGQEKEAISEELARAKRETMVKSTQTELLNKQLAKERAELERSREELEQVTGHRDRLLDKVERLHADKHALEARLNTLERASMYEQTWSENWTDELDGEESSFGESLDTDPSSCDPSCSAGKGVREKRGTESDVTDSVQSDGGEGESSEPESTAVCSAPII